MMFGDRTPAIGLALLAGGIIAYAIGWKRLRRRWMIRNLPTSRVRSAAIGMAELAGKVRLTAAEPVVSPVRRLSCAWWRVLVTRHAESADGKRRHTSNVVDLTMATPFHLEDDTGKMLVLPDGAEVHGDPFCDVHLGGMQSAGDDDVHRFLRSKGLWPTSPTITYRVREWALLADADAYILGEVALPGPGAAAERRRRIAEKLRLWARDPAARADADRNDDGIIQPEEWDAAKAKAQEEILAEDVSTGKGDAAPQVAMRKPRDGYFIISSGSETQALARVGWGGTLVAAGAAGIAGGLGLLVPYLQRWVP